MRIVNILGSPLYLSYGTKTKGGITLQPNDQTTVELSIETIHHKQLWKDVESNKVQFTLCDDDRKFIQRVLDHANQPVRRVEPKSRTPAPKPEVNVKPAPPNEFVKAVLKSPLGSPLTNAEHRQAGIQQMKDMPETLMGAPKSLKDLQSLNATTK